ncbi:diguanylate cyclase [Rhizobium sp. Root274]|uniref:DinB family protein n=1 Tax=unclassified Rhizobium TaxID=2613769 RepID=UPI0007134225|nr:MULTISPECIES: DinB family protein [unclassified Rhizobium]KQW30981.1 diguanylate cyclase [Rhizobium sp. Root1240]KRD32527.1 diguanylate cyclase [Rhizobium sp. Root274]
MENLKMMAAYNRWANGLVYDAAGALSEEELHCDTGAFFGSIFGTLSHLLTADRIWLNRFTGQGPRPSALNECPCASFAELREARAEEDGRIIAYVENLTAAQLEGQISYTPLTSSERIQQRLSPALSHMFNHQTHHRGQVHAGLTGMGKPSLAIDLIYFLRSDGRAWL